MQSILGRAFQAPASLPKISKRLRRNVGAHRQPSGKVTSRHVVMANESSMQRVDVVGDGVAKPSTLQTGSQDTMINNHQSSDSNNSKNEVNLSIDAPYALTISFDGGSSESFSKITIDLESTDAEGKQSIAKPPSKITIDLQSNKAEHEQTSTKPLTKIIVEFQSKVAESKEHDVDPRTLNDTIPLTLNDTNLLTLKEVSSLNQNDVNPLNQNGVNPLDQNDVDSRTGIARDHQESDTGNKQTDATLLIETPNGRQNKATEDNQHDVEPPTDATSDDADASQNDHPISAECAASISTEMMYDACAIEDSKVHPSLIAALRAMNVTSTMQSQARLLHGKDTIMLLNEQSGTGKTFAACLSLLDVALRARDDSGARPKGKFAAAKPFAMYIAHTKPFVDEAMQLAAAIRQHGDDKLQALTFGAYCTGAKFGGPSRISNACFHTDILFGTPGKVYHSIACEDIDVGRASLVVFEGADEIFGRRLEEDPPLVKLLLRELRRARARHEIPETSGLSQTYIGLASNASEDLYTTMIRYLDGERQQGCLIESGDLCVMDVTGTAIHPVEVNEVQGIDEDVQARNECVKDIINDDIERGVRGQSYLIIADLQSSCENVAEYLVDSLLFKASEVRKVYHMTPHKVKALSHQQFSDGLANVRVLITTFEFATHWAGFKNQPTVIWYNTPGGYRKSNELLDVYKSAITRSARIGLHSDFWLLLRHGDRDDERLCAAIVPFYDGREERHENPVDGFMREMAISYYNKSSASKKSKGGPKCYICEKAGHVAFNCPQCKHCKQEGHFYFECPNKVEECRNCGEQGHSKDDCTKCKYCNFVEHGVEGCPVCRKCKTEHGEEDCLKVQKGQKDPICYTCHAPGHKSANCPSKEDVDEEGEEVERIKRVCNNLGFDWFDVAMS